MRAILLTVEAFLIFAGCSATEEAIQTHSGIATISLRNLGALDSAREQYVLWLRSNGAWQSYAMTNGVQPATSDTIIYRVAIPSVVAFDSAKLSIEALTIPKTATSVVAAAMMSANRATLKSGLPDLSNASAIATFATRDADTNRAKHEFYLMQFGKGDLETSIVDLPSPPTGWRYVIWVINTNFIPNQNLFFGSFIAPQGASPDAFATSFDFPGGYYVGDFLSEGARVSVTLEPAANLVMRPRHASSLEIMQGQLHRFINRNDTIALSDVWTPPSAQIVIQ
jgi:hypothetical protein